MKISTKATLFFLVLAFQLAGQPSPFGTGQITNQNIGPLEDDSVVLPSESGYGFNDFFPDAQELLQDYNFDIYVPDDYDGTEAYGLVTFINSGNNGGFKSQWLSVLADKKLIWIAGDDIGNSIFINIRMGVGMAAALRMQELFNIDSERIYTSGNSGGARMAHNLAFIYPEIFKGAMPSCGGSYIREVDQDYETQEPDGHYEAILNYPSDYLAYLLPFDQRFANMTSFNDFREGDIMNIYHNGSEPDGLKGKILETSGNHCATTTEHFRDAVNFLEHPFLEVIQEDFAGETSSYFRTTNAVLANSVDLELEHSSAAFAQIQSKDLFLWNDPMGAIFETSIQLAPSIFNANTSFYLGVWSMEAPENYCAFAGTQLNDDIPAILLSVDFADVQPTLSVEVKNPSQPGTELLFTSTFSDWEIGEPLPIKYHLWDQELRIELGAHLMSPSTTVSGVRLLDDARSIRIRWEELATNFWEDAVWADGAFLTLASKKRMPAESASNLFVNRVELITADVNIATEIPHTSSEMEAAICQGEAYLFYDENLTESGTYIATLTNAVGCDSLVSLDLTVNVLPVVEIVEMDGTLAADDSFQTYQWFLDGEILTGETEHLITPNEDGNYYVEVSNENACEGISNTINFISTSVEATIASQVFIYPNPTTGELIINSANPFFEAELFDVYGRRVAIKLGPSNDISHLASGIYFLVLQREEHTAVFKIQKSN